MLDEANLTSCDEIADLRLKESILSNNFDISNSVQLALDNLNNHTNDFPSISALITQSIKQLTKVAEFDSKINDLNENLINIQIDVDKLFGTS